MHKKVHIDKSWMQLRGRYLPGYVKGIEDFIEYARASADRANRIRCPCAKCNNRYYMHIDEVRKHLLDVYKGMDKTYTRWVYHGEKDYEVLSEDEDELGGTTCEGLQEMLEDLQGGTKRHVIPEDDALSSSDPRESGPSELLFKDAKLPLHPGCADVKVKYDEMIQIRAESAPKGPTLPTEEEIFEPVLGKRLAYFRGLDHGVEPSSSISSSHTLCDARVQDANKRAKQALQEAVQAREELVMSHRISKG